MLVLSRKRDESIVVGENIVITVVDIRGDKVRLGIQASKEIPVHRQEVYEAIQRENMRAGGETPTNPPVFPNPSILSNKTRDLIMEEASVKTPLLTTDA